MILSIRKKLIATSAIAVILALTSIFAVVLLTSISQLNNTLDTITDLICMNGGMFPEVNEKISPLPKMYIPSERLITEETQFSTRFFTVWLDENKNVVSENIDSIASLSKKEIDDYGKCAVNKKATRGWISEYRFKVEKVDNGYMAVFVNGNVNRFLTYRLLVSFFLIMIASGMGVLVFVFIISKKIARPIYENYEKQKQFITDANHELKTPLTLILSNLEILEAEIGKNEWLEDIKYEGERMKHLINQLVSLTRMDEDKSDVYFLEFDLTNTVKDMVSEFKPFSEERGKKLNLTVDGTIKYDGNEGDIRKLISILLDNAVKYCDKNGNIDVIIEKKRTPVITVENTCKDTDSIELDKLFDRFYKGDKSRVYDGSFGIGLSIAKAIVQKHSGEITPYTKQNIIGFKITLK